MRSFTYVQVLKRFLNLFVYVLENARFDHTSPDRIVRTLR